MQEIVVAAPSEQMFYLNNQHGQTWLNMLNIHHDQVAPPLGNTSTALNHNVSMQLSTS